MSVYVDRLRQNFPFAAGRKWRYGESCHMIGPRQELEAMARQLGLRRDWKHGDHYDLTANKRRLAVAAGALEVDDREFLRIRRVLWEIDGVGRGGRR